MVAVIEDSRFNQSEPAQAARQWMISAGIELQLVSDVMKLTERVKSDLHM